jgi:hypothetical protein
MMVNLLDDSNFHRQAAVMIRLIEVIIQNPVNLSSPGCNEINVMSLFNTIPRTKRSHGLKKIQHPNVKNSSKPRTLQDTFNDLLSSQAAVMIRLIEVIIQNPVFGIFCIISMLAHPTSQCLTSFIMVMCIYYASFYDVSM